MYIAGTRSYKSTYSYDLPGTGDRLRTLPTLLYIPLPNTGSLPETFELSRRSRTGSVIRPLNPGPRVRDDHRVVGSLSAGGNRGKEFYV